MNFLLDTNVLSEVRRPVPDSNVLAWLDQVDEDRVHLSVISIAEIARGIALLDDGRRKHDLAIWLEHELPHASNRGFSTLMRRPHCCGGR